MQNLKQDIESLGGINLVVIDEYKRLSGRYEFISGQKEEVSGFILLLEEAITEIEDTSLEKFAAILRQSIRTSWIFSLSYSRWRSASAAG